MTNPILVPLDGSAESESILPEVVRVLPPKGKVHLATFTPAVEKGEEYLDRIRGRWFSDQAGINIVRNARPADGILRLALEKNIHLIAMTTHARLGLRRRFLGSVAAEVVRKSQLPVLLTRPNAAAPAKEIRRLLVPVDGDQAPKDLLASLKLLCPVFRPEIVLFRVLPPLQDPNPQWSMSLSIQSTPEHRLQAMADLLEEEGFEAWPVTCVGKPGEEILIHAANLKADLIAMSTHGRSGLDRLLEGSVSEQVLRRSPVGVLLQRPLVIRKPVAAGASDAV